MAATVRTRCNFILKPHFERAELWSPIGAEVTAPVLELRICQHPHHPAPRLFPTGPCDWLQRGPGATQAGKLVSASPSPGPVPRFWHQPGQMEERNGFMGRSRLSPSKLWSLTSFLSPLPATRLGYVPLLWTLVPLSPPLSGCVSWICASLNLAQSPAQSTHHLIGGTFIENELSAKHCIKYFCTSELLNPTWLTFGVR